MKQRILTSFFKREKSKKSESSSDSGDESLYAPSKKKSMFSAPMSWTRVKYVHAVNVSRPRIYDVEEDLKADKSLRAIRKGAVRELGEMLFDPEDFKDQADQLRVNDYKLDEDQLFAYAKLATTIRQQIKQKACEAGEEQEKSVIGQAQEDGVLNL